MDYSCSKIGVVAFHEELRQELRWRYWTVGVRTRYLTLDVLNLLLVDGAMQKADYEQYYASELGEAITVSSPAG